MKRILAIDYGSKRVGLALSDPLKLISSPYKTIINNGLNLLIDELKTIIATENVEEVIVGLPLYLDGKNSKQTNIIQKFIEKIRSELCVEITTYDERYSSAEAKELLLLNHHSHKKSNRSNRKNKGIIDQIAASIILQNYLNDHNQFEHSRQR